MTLALRFSVKTKLFGGFFLICLLMVAVLVTSYVALFDAQSSQRRLVEENFGNLYDLPTLRSNLNAQRLAFAMLLESDSSNSSFWLNELDTRRRAGDEIINNLILRFRNNQTESNLLGSLIALRDSYQDIQDRQIRLLLGERRKAEAKALFSGVQADNHSRLRSLITSLENLEMEEAKKMVAQTEKSAGRNSRAFLIMGFLGLGISAILAFYTARTVSSNVAELKSREVTLSRVNRSLLLLNKCTAIALHAQEESSLLEEICREMVSVGGYKLVWIGYADDDKEKSVRPVAFAGGDGDYIEHAKISWADNERGKGPTGTVIRTGEHFIVPDTSIQPDYDPWRYRANEKGYRSSATFPIKNSQKVYGALMIYAGMPNAFDEEEIQLLDEIAETLSFTATAIRDQSARLQAECSAREVAAYNRNLLEASLDPFIAMSPTGKITDVNKAAENLIGKCRSELVGSNFSEFLPDRGKADLFYRKIIEEETLRFYRLRIRAVSGRIAEVLFNASVVRTEAGELEGIFVSAREIPESAKGLAI